MALDLNVKRLTMCLPVVAYQITLDHHQIVGQNVALIQIVQVLKRALMNDARILVLVHVVSKQDVV